MLGCRLGEVLVVLGVVVLGVFACLLIRVVLWSSDPFPLFVVLLVVVVGFFVLGCFF